LSAVAATDYVSLKSSAHSSVARNLATPDTATLNFAALHSSTSDSVARNSISLDSSVTVTATPDTAAPNFYMTDNVAPNVAALNSTINNEVAGEVAKSETVAVGVTDVVTLGAAAREDVVADGAKGEAADVAAAVAETDPVSQPKIVSDKSARSDYILWCDCEMTGLDLGHDELIEIAVLVTDWDLKVQDEGVSLIIQPSPEALSQMTAEVRTMHTKNGLLAKLDQGISTEEADQILLAYVRKFEPNPGRILLAGNSIHSDQKFIAKQLPGLAHHLHYRLLDVSTIKVLAQVWYPKDYRKFQKAQTHRALDDIIESINELGYYRERIFK
jgi:oligoribonuclease